MTFVSDFYMARTSAFKVVNGRIITGALNKTKNKILYAWQK